MTTLLLGLAGALVGLAGWALCGLGLAELGILARFDPVGVGPVDTGNPLPPPTAFESIAEWSFPVWALLGSVLLPKFVRWAVRSPGEIETGT